jgi:hypothetical protein
MYDDKNTNTILDEKSFSNNIKKMKKFKQKTQNP